MGLRTKRQQRDVADIKSSQKFDQVGAKWTRVNNWGKSKYFLEGIANGQRELLNISEYYQQKMKSRTVLACRSIESYRVIELEEVAIVMHKSHIQKRN